MNDIKNIKKKLDCDEQSLTINRNNQNDSYTSRSKQQNNNSFTNRSRQNSVNHVSRSNYKVNDENMMNDHTQCKKMMNGILQKIR